MILMLGDIHGNFNYLKQNIKQKRIDNCVIIQVGDFGLDLLMTIMKKLC
jgi:hypothetical protein